MAMFDPVCYHRSEETNPLCEWNLLQFFSSAPLLQSALPSQCQLLGMHWCIGAPQLNCDGRQVLEAEDRNRKSDGFLEFPYLDLKLCCQLSREQHTTIRKHFVRPVAAVVCSIADPPAGDAPPIPTLQLRGAACERGVCTEQKKCYTWVYQHLHFTWREAYLHCLVVIR